MSPLETPRNAGFSVVELMIIVAIVAIVATIAVPSFNDLIVQNRLSSQTNELIAGVGLARTAAIETNSGGGFCPANASQSGCGGSWQNGWLVWADANGNGNADPDEVLSVGTVNEKDLLAGLPEIRFDGRGRRESPAPGAGNATLRLSAVVCPSGKGFVRTLTVTPVGSVTTDKESC
jgi:type IV fimbrial biogenesis protein FimT